ncbi:MAG TPA: serine/threonine-protein kinase [Waterburya sp.]|jgi:WD40 repeat protein
MLGATLSGRYKIVKYLGGGGFGQTYLAEDLQLPGNPICVVKQLKPISTDPFTLKTAKRLFDREAQVLYQLGNHEQIPRLLAHFEQEQEFYLVQEFIEGHDLKQELPSGKQFSEIQVIDFCQEILKILEFVHQQGVIHRDIKPSNLMRRKQDGKIVLIDFGAVKQVSVQSADSDGQTSLTVAIGSPGYMPNEQQSGRPQFCSDIYAVGMIAIQALTGVPPNQLPEDPKTSEILWHDKWLHNTLHQQVQASCALADVLDKMVRYDYRQRYPTATEAWQALEQLTQSYSSSTTVSASQVSHTVPVDPSEPTVAYSLSNQVPGSPGKNTLDTVEPTQAPPSQQQLPLSLASSGTLAEPQVSDQTSESMISKPRQKSPQLLKIGAGIVTAVALTVGLYYFQELTLSSTESQWVQKIALSKTLPSDSTLVNPVAMTPDGKTLAMGGDDGTIRLWNVQTGKFTNTLKSHTSGIYALSFSPDGTTLVSGSADATIKIWNSHSGNLIRTLKRRSKAGVSALAISPDGTTLISGDRIGTMEIWSLGTGELINFFAGHTILVTALAINSDGQTLVSSSQDNTIKLWELQTGKLMRTLTAADSHPFFAVALTADAETVAGGGGDGVIRLWERRTGKLIKSLQVGSAPINVLTFKPHGKTLVSGSGDGIIRLWDVQTGKPRRTLTGHSAAVNSLAISNDGQTLVSSSQDKTISIWRSP